MEKLEFTIQYVEEFYTRIINRKNDLWEDFRQEFIRNLNAFLII